MSNDNSNPFGVGTDFKGGEYDEYSKTFTPSMHVEGSASELGNGHAAGSILATARKAGWGAPAVEIKDDTRVMVSGMEMTALQAAHLGVLRKENGQYVETGAAAIPQREAPTVDPVDAQLQALEYRIGPSAVMSLTETVLKGGSLDAVSESQLQQLGITRDEFIAEAGPALARTQARIDATLTTDLADALAEWSTGSPETRREFDAAVRDIHYLNDSRRIHALMRRMISTLRKEG